VAQSSGTGRYHFLYPRAHVCFHVFDVYVTFTTGYGTGALPSARDTRQSPKTLGKYFFEKKASTTGRHHRLLLRLHPCLYPRHHRAREGVWARAAVLSDGVAAFPALDLWPPSLPWIHATVLSERGRELDPATPLAPALAAASAGGGRWWGPARPGSVSRETAVARTRARRPPPPPAATVDLSTGEGERPRHATPWIRAPRG